MGDATPGPIRLSFNPQLRVEFRGATVTSDAGLLLPRELDERLGLALFEQLDRVVDSGWSPSATSQTWPGTRRTRRQWSAKPGRPAQRASPGFPASMLLRLPDGRGRLTHQHSCRPGG